MSLIISCRERPTPSLRKFLLLAVLVPLVLAAGWYYFHERSLPGYGPLYREYAYISNGKSNTVTVIDLRSFRPVRTLQVGATSLLA